MTTFPQIQPLPKPAYDKRREQDEFLALQRQVGGGVGQTAIAAVGVLDSSATPSVAGGEDWKTVASGADITDFDDGVPGQHLYIEAADSIVITYGASIIRLVGAANYDMTVTDTLHLKMFTDGIWTEISRSVI